MESKAIFFPDKGVLETRCIDVPNPDCDELQIKMLVSGICMLEVFNFQQRPSPDKIQGHEGLGEIIQVGEKVTQFRPGDLIGGYLPWSEYCNVKEKDAVRLQAPRDLLPHWLVEPASCAINSLHASDVYPGERAVLFGAGYMGLLLIQMLRLSPLSHLVVVDYKSENLKLARSFGADATIDLSDPQGQEALAALEDGSFDLCLECSGAADPIEQCTRLVRFGGKINIYSFHHQKRLIDLGAWHEKGIRVFNTAPGIVADEKAYRSFVAADRLLAAKKLNQEKLITHRHPLAKVKEALDLAVRRPEGYIKGILTFEEGRHHD